MNKTAVVMIMTALRLYQYVIFKSVPKLTANELVIFVVSKAIFSISIIWSSSQLITDMSMCIYVRLVDEPLHHQV